MKKLFISLSILIVLYLGVAMLGHVAQLTDLADRVKPGSGLFVFWILITILYGAPIAMLGLFACLPKPLLPPSKSEGPEHDAFLLELASRLRHNPLLSGQKIESPDEINQALGALSTHANQVIRNTSSAVFVSTAVMQNGRLDGLIVLGTQLRLIWRIARIYYQRPSPRQLLNLYGNVSANVLIADNIQEIDFTEISAPIVTSIFPSLKGAIPGLEGIASLLVNSMANGTANAFLTLRIGIISRSYCEAVVTPEKGLIRNSATIQALSLVKEIAVEQGSEIARRAWESVKGVAIAATDKTLEIIKSSGQKAADVTTNTAKAVTETAANTWQTVSGAVSKRLSKHPSCQIEQTTKGESCHPSEQAEGR